MLRTGAHSSAPKTVLIVVNVLPLVFERDAGSPSSWDVTWATGATAMLYRTLVRDTEQYSPLFIGCPEVFVAKNQEAAVEKQLIALRCVPVFLDPAIAHRYFQGFCKGVLWPIFHNVVDVYNSAELQLDSEEKNRHRWFEGKEEDSRSDTSAWCDPVSWNPAAQDMCWSDYCSVNRTFARRVVENYHEGDLVWLHDFHFLMLPSYLLRQLRTALVTMYLHIPFPSSEIFRCLAMRTEILRAMLCADHIGFLIFEHARHFLTSCKRLLGLDYKTCPNGMLVIEYNGRKVHISCSHVEPNVNHLYEMLDQNDAEVNDIALDFAADVKSAITAGCDPNQRRVVIGSVDRVEGLTAIPLKLRAFDRFLATHPEKRGAVVLVQIGIILDSRPNDYHRTRDYILKFTEEINHRYAPSGGIVVYFKEKRKTTCAERVVLWRMCDIYLDTCVRGGLSLLPFEYMIAQHRNVQSRSRSPSGWSSPKGTEDASTSLTRGIGIMIVSEFSAYSRILSGCLTVNPWKTDDMVEAFAKACGMSYYEKHNRFYMNYKFSVGRSDAIPWGERLLADVTAVTEKMADGSSGEVVQVGFGFDFRVMCFESGFVCLDVDELVKKCMRTSRRLFIFDYGGTLSSTTSIFDEEGVQFSTRNEGTDSFSPNFDATDWSDGNRTGPSLTRNIDGKVRKPVSDETKAILQTLCADPSTIVFITSSTQCAALEDQFGEIANLNLVAESGLYIRQAGRDRWECICDETKRTFDWKADVKSVMQAYAARTNGSFIVENAASLLYDYRNSDQEYGELQSLELSAQLRKILERREASITRARGYVEVHQSGVSKAIAVSLILTVLKEQVDVPEFAFVVGDDESDEEVFQAIHAFADREPQLEHVVTCTVGKKPSSAKHYVDNTSDILTALQAIAVRLRLTSARPRLFQPPCTYSHQFSQIQTLVSNAFLQMLDKERRLSSMLSSKSTMNMTSGQDTDESQTPKTSEASLRNWTFLGAAAVAGGLIGAVVATKRHAVLHHVQRHFFSDSFERLLKRGDKQQGESRRRGRPRASLIFFCTCLKTLVMGPYSNLVVAIAGLLVLVGVACSTIALVGSYSADEYLFLGAFASGAFTLVIIFAFVMSPAVRAHPNPLIFSKSLVDLLLAMIYMAEYCVTEFSNSVVMPFRVAAITQALLIAGEFWFFAIPIDMVQSITNPFTSYAHNFRVYWFYSVLSGIVCGLVLWLFGRAEVKCITTGGSNVDCTKATEDKEQRFIWFHHNTDMPGFFWHQWILYHMCVVVYLLFGLACMIYVRSRLRRGLEETFEVRRRVLSNGMLTCAVFISWSFLMICLFTVTNTATAKALLGKVLFKELIDLSAFMHASRGCVNIIVWIVVNAPYFPSYCADEAAEALQNDNGRPTRASFHGERSRSEASGAKYKSHKQEEKLMNPQLNVALRKQMIHMATNGIIESIQHHQRLRRENGSNCTFQLDWQRSPQRTMKQLLSFSAIKESVGSMTIPPRSRPMLREIRNSTVRVVEEPRDNPSNMQFTFMPLTLTEMQFYDFQPRVFASIRQLYGIDDAEYIFAFRMTINERISEGRSGAFVFNTCDRKYLVKSTTSTEKDVLLRLLPSYLRYLKWNPSTLLPRFFGFHAMKMYGQIFYFIVMGNFLSTTEVIHRRYDIKGSWVDRNAPACVLGEKYRCSKCNRFFIFGGPPGTSCFLPGEEHYPDITLRDNDLKKRLKLEPETAIKLVKQLTRDSYYLASAGIMDYSLLIGAHYSHFTITTENKRSLSRHKSMDRTVQCDDTHADADSLLTYNENQRFANEGDVTSEGTRPSESSDVSHGTHFSDPTSSSPPPERGVYPASHAYHAHQVSGPSKYYFGLVDILQEWTIAKQIERAYKVQVLRKSPNGVSAIPPKLYARRFQRKMKQLFIMMPTHPLESFEDDDAPNEIPACEV